MITVKSLSLDQVRTIIEHVMLDLPKQQKRIQHKEYLAGFIEALAETNQIPENFREILYHEYVG